MFSAIKFWQQVTDTEKTLQERVDILTERVNELLLERDTLTGEKVELAAELAQLSQKKKMDEEMIAHKLAMHEEKLEIDKQKEIAATERSADERVADVKDQYRDKIESQLEKRGNELKEMYSEILERLPDVNLAIEQRSEKTS